MFLPSWFSLLFHSSHFLVLSHLHLKAYKECFPEIISSKCYILNYWDAKTVYQFSKLKALSMRYSTELMFLRNVHAIVVSIFIYSNCASGKSIIIISEAVHA